MKVLFKSLSVFLIGILTQNIAAQRLLSDTILIEMMNTTAFEQEEKEVKVNVGGRVFSALIHNNDTIIVADLANVNVSSPKSFKNRKEYYRYMKYRNYASSVFPYAQEAIRIFNEAEYATQHMKKRKRKKHHKKLARDLKKKFEKPLKKLSKTQGKILIKMIERELGKNMYQLIKNANGWWKAAYWNTTSKWFGYRLKEGYTYGQDPILDIVLMDFDISYDLSAK